MKLKWIRKRENLPISPGVRLTIQEFTLKVEKKLTRQQRKEVARVRIVIDSERKDVTVLIFPKSLGECQSFVYDWYGKEK